MNLFSLLTSLALIAVGQTTPESADDAPIRVLILAGNAAHRWHNWERTTPALTALLERDPRVRVEVSHDLEDLGRKRLADYQVIVQNYCNWHDPKGVSARAKTAFIDFLRSGGGLVVVHFANGAFHSSLPGAGASDWPEYRKIVRRVWDHAGQSGHDAFGRFTVRVTAARHPITSGLTDFAVIDELYYRQAGNEPVEPLLTARSRVTGRDEPLAFAYSYGKGRVFQTLLGHSAQTYDTFEAREIVRRAVAWAAGRPVRSLRPVQDPGPAARSKALLNRGRFGQALDARSGAAFAPARLEYREPPLTVECWARLDSKRSYNILLASEPKASARHWELFTLPGSGHFTAYLPGLAPDHVHTRTDICDGKWHYLAMVIEPDRVTLTIDGRAAASAKVRRVRPSEKQSLGGLAFGILVERSLRCDGALDEVRLSRGVRAIRVVPEGPFADDAQTIGLWHFDAAEAGKIADESRLRNSARLDAKPTPLPAAQGPTPPPGVQSIPADPRLKAVLLDRVESEVFLSVKPDPQGRLFVGGRETLFVYESDDAGGYRPRQVLHRFPADSLITGIELRGDDLYVLTSSALYVIPGGRTQRANLRPRRLVWGLPVDLHVSFHCLAWGPQGDLYFNHGDPLLNYGDFDRPDHWGHWTLYTQPEGTKVPFTGQGAVLRVRPDGSGLRVVANGLRGPVGLCFDRQWNLFTNDNDHESRADLYTPARLLHVTPHVDFAWPRGWTPLRALDRADLVQIMNTDAARGVPVGLAYNDDPLLPAEYRGRLLHGRWESAAITLCSLTPRGASFTAQEKPFVKGQPNARTMAVALGQGGRLFFSSLYLTGNVGVPHCVSDLVMVVPKQGVARPESLDVTRLPDELLWAELSRSSWERRSQAHLEILRRGGPLLTQAVGKLAVKRSHDDPAWLHLPWLAGAAGGAKAARQLQALARHTRPELRLQAVRVFAEYRQLSGAAKVLDAALDDLSPSVQLAALPAYDADARLPLPLAKVTRLAAGTDSYLRQTAARLLARRAALSEIAALFKAPEPNQRRAGVLAAGFRLTVPPTHTIPSERMRLSYTSGNAHFVLQYADEKGPIDLKKLGRVGSFTIAEAWKVVPHDVEQERLFALLLRAAEDRVIPVRAQAVYFLGLLRDPRSEPIVVKVRREAPAQDLAKTAPQPVVKVWRAGPFPVMGAHPPERGVIDLTESYTTPAGPRSWHEQSHSKGHALAEDAAPGTWYVLFRLSSAGRQPVMLHFGAAAPHAVWHNGRRITEGVVPAAVLLDVQPGSNDLLVRVRHTNGAKGLALSFQARGGVKAELPAKVDGATLAQRLRQADPKSGGVKVAEAFLRVDWPAEIPRGDAKRGRLLFGTLGCAKCHAVVNDQTGGGAPSLADARKRFTIAHLVESVLVPGKQVAEPFRSTVLETRQGQVFSGLVIGETAETVELLLPDTTRRSIARPEIESRQVTTLSPMPPGLVRTPAELRDLLAYLLSDDPLPP